MKSQSTSCLKLLKSIKTALVLECKEIEAKLSGEKEVVTERKLAVYQAPKYHNETRPRKQYIVKLGEIDWDCDVYGVDNKFVYETSTDPFDFDKNDEDDSMYGVAADFYAELIETLSVEVCEIWNEPEVLSIEEKKMVTEKEKTIASIKFIDEEYPADNKNIKTYRVVFANELGIWEPEQNMNELVVDLTTNVRPITVEDFGDIDTDSVEFGFDTCAYYDGTKWHKDATFNESFYNALCDALIEELGYKGEDPKVESIALRKNVRECKGTEKKMVTEEDITAHLKCTDKNFPSDEDDYKMYYISFEEEMGIWEPWQRMNEYAFELYTNVPVLAKDSSDVEQDLKCNAYYDENGNRIEDPSISKSFDNVMRRALDGFQYEFPVIDFIKLCPGETY